jgi:glycosyltransferase involved in cell wall biosynthesis
VVDDASNQNVEKLIGDFADSRIRLLRHKQNGGEAAARNTGLHSAKGKYVAFLDDDDEWMREKLARQVQVLETTPAEVAAVYTPFLWFSWPDRQLLGKRSSPYTNGNFFNSLLKRNIVGTPSTVIVRKQCLDRIGLFDREIAYGVDHDLWMRLAERYKFLYLPEFLVKCHVHENRLTNNLEILIQGQRDMMKKYPPTIASYRHYHSRRCLAIGEKLCLNGDVERGRKLLFYSIQMSWTNWRSYFDLALLYLGPRIFIKGRKIRQTVGGLFRRKLSPATHQELPNEELEQLTLRSSPAKTS